MTSPPADAPSPEPDPVGVGPDGAPEGAGDGTGAAVADPAGTQTDPAPEAATEAEGAAFDPYDAVVLTSFGGPEAPDEVVPFLRRVTRGRGIPDERLEEVGEHYYQFGGKSPINDQNRALLVELRAELDRRGLSALPLLWANRFSEPFMVDTLRQADDAGLRSLLAVTTSAYSSYSSCRAYREDYAEALAELAAEGRTIRLDKIRPYYNHPGFSATTSSLTLTAVQGYRQRTGVLPHLLFVTHSIPDAMDDTSGPGDGPGNLYSLQHRNLAAAIVEEIEVTVEDEIGWDLTYCSRSGPPSQPWLEPDVNDRMSELAEQGVRHVILVPFGFVSDHMEVLFDLDTEAKQTAADLDIDMERVPTVGIDAGFVAGLVDLIEERAAQARGEDVATPTWPPTDPMPPVCAAGCCPNLRVAKPAICGQD